MKKYIIYIAVIALIGFGIYKKIYIPKHTYEVTQAQKSNINIKVNGVGNVGAKDIYKIGSVYGGKVLNLNINEGEFIKKGTLIANIDSVDLQDKLDEQVALLDKLNSDIKSLKIEKQSATTSYNYQYELYIKNSKLYKKHAISQLDFKKYRTNKDVAALQISSIKAKIESLNNQMKQLKASINGLKQRLQRYTIISPVDGYVVKKYISNFQIISPNQAIIDIVDPKDVWVKTYVDTRMSGDVNIGAKAMIKLRSASKKVPGHVVNIKPINNSVTNEREIDVAFDNLPIPFYLEEQAVVNINTKDLKDVITVPTKVLTVYKEKTGVFILKNKKVKFIPLDIIAYQDKEVAVKKFDINNKIVIPNPKNKPLKDDMSIIVK